VLQLPTVEPRIRTWEIDFMEACWSISGHASSHGDVATLRKGVPRQANMVSHQESPIKPSQGSRMGLGVLQ